MGISVICLPEKDLPAPIGSTTVEPHALPTPNKSSWSKDYRTPCPSFASGLRIVSRLINGSERKTPLGDVGVATKGPTATAIAVYSG